jgi:hypothetical protein
LRHQRALACGFSFFQASGQAAEFTCQTSGQAAEFTCQTSGQAAEFTCQASGQPAILLVGVAFQNSRHFNSC